MKKGRTKRTKPAKPVKLATGGQVPGFGTDLGGGNFLAPFQQQQQGQGGSLLAPTNQFETQPLSGFSGSSSGNVGQPGQSWNEQTSQWQAAPYSPMAVNQQPDTLPFFSPPPGSAAANQPQPAVNQQPQMNMQTLGRFMPYSQYLGGQRFHPYYGPSPSSQGSQDGGAAGGQLGPTGNFSPIGGSQSSGVTGGALSQTGNFSPGPGQTGLPGLTLASIGYGANGFYGGVPGFSFGEQAAPSAQIGLGAGGVNFAVSPTENALTNSVAQQTLNQGVNMAGGRTGLSLGALLGMVAPAAGNILGSVVSPVTAAYGMFNQAVNLGTTLANAQGIPTVQQGLQSLQASLTSPSEAGRSVGEQSLSIAQGLMSGQLAESDLATMNLSPTQISQINAAMTSQGAVGFADSSSPRGYSGALGMQGPQGAAFGLNESNPSVQQGFALNNPGVGPLSNAVMGHPQTLSEALTLTPTFAAPVSTGREDNTDPTATAATAPTEAALGELGINTDITEGAAAAGSLGTGIGTGTGPGNAGPGSVSAGGVANAGNTGVGQANDASTSAAAADAAAAAAAAAATADASAAASGTGGGGGSDGGGCHAATWSLGNDSRHKDLAPLAKLKQAFFKENPQHAPQLFAMYQRAATQIIQAAQRQGPEVVKQVQGQIRHALVDKTREHMKGKNASSQEAVKNLIAVMTGLARQLGVQLPGQGGRFVPMGG